MFMHRRGHVPGAVCLAAAMFAVLPADAAEQAGVAAAVRGRVEIAVRSGVVGRLVRSGEPVFLGNAITSGPESGLQIMLLDQTTFTIGPDSQITIDEFVYNPRSGAGKVTASVAKGVFRFVTGKVAQRDPAAMEVRLPTGGIGIRGTIAAGRVDRVRRNGEVVDRQQVILVGPGSRAEGGSRRGSLELTANGASTTINVPGFGSTLIGRDGRWTPPERFAAGLLQQITQTLQIAAGARGDQVVATSVDAAFAGFQDAAGAVALLSDLASDLGLAALLEAEASQPDRQELDDLGVPAGPATFAQVLSIAQGQFHWSQGGVPLAPLSDTYSIALNIDFGARTIGGGNSRLDFSGGSLPAASLPLPAIAYGAMGALPADINGGTPFASSICGGACRVALTLGFFNADGVIAQRLNHDVNVSNAATGATVATGNGSTDRRPGLAP
jgi:hypothetical protein